MLAGFPLAGPEVSSPRLLSTDPLMRSTQTTEVGAYRGALDSEFGGLLDIPPWNTPARAWLCGAACWCMRACCLSVTPLRLCILARHPFPLLRWSVRSLRSAIPPTHAPLGPLALVWLPLTGRVACVSMRPFVLDASRLRPMLVSTGPSTSSLLPPPPLPPPPQPPPRSQWAPRQLPQRSRPRPPRLHPAQARASLSWQRHRHTSKKTSPCGHTVRCEEIDGGGSVGRRGLGGRGRNRGKLYRCIFNVRRPVPHGRGSTKIGLSHFSLSSLPRVFAASTSSARTALLSPSSAMSAATEPAPMPMPVPAPAPPPSAQAPALAAAPPSPAPAPAVRSSPAPAPAPAPAPPPAASVPSPAPAPVFFPPPPGRAAAPRTAAVASPAGPSG